MTQQRGVAAALLVLLLVAASTVSADQPAELELVFQGSHRVLLGVNRTWCVVWRAARQQLVSCSGRADSWCDTHTTAALAVAQLLAVQGRQAPCDHTSSTSSSTSTCSVNGQ
jgi:hypothetical protein